MSELQKIINRHMARMLTDLEDANCPKIYRDAVKSGLSWLRSDLEEEINGGDYE